MLLQILKPQSGGPMANSMTNRYLDNNVQYAGGQAVHKPVYPGKQPIQPSKHVAVLACMDARLDVEDLLGLQTGDAHIIRNAGGVMNDDAIRCLVISHHLLNTNEIILIHQRASCSARRRRARSRAARSAQRRPQRFTPSAARSSRSTRRATKRTSS